MITTFNFDVRSVILKRSFYDGQFQNKAIQSVCYDPKRGKYLIGFSNNDDASKATIVLTKNLSFTNESVEKIAHDLPLAHCNDMTYDPENDRVIVALGDDRIAEIDPERLTVTLVRSIGCTVWSIARYENGEYFTHDGNTGRIWDKDFQNNRIISQNDTFRVVSELDVPYDKDAGQYAGYWQGAEIIAGVPRVLYTEWGTKPGYFKSCCLIAIGEDDIFRAETEFETESICIVDGEIKMIYGNIHIGGAQMDLGQIKTVCGTVKNVAIGTDATTINCSEFVPSGYKFVTAQINMTYNGKTYQLPYMDNTGKNIAWIIRAKDRKITIRSTKNFGKVNLTITGTCEKK